MMGFARSTCLPLACHRTSRAYAIDEPPLRVIAESLAMATASTM